MDANKTEMVPVPLPTEIPTPPRLENLPLDILHSATVEMLIQQNEDLSARLKVNIRRNSQLERRVLDLEQTAKTSLQKQENLAAQNEIIKEKEKIWTQQKEEKDKRLQQAESDISLLNTRYSELYNTSSYNLKDQQKQLTKKQLLVESLQRKLTIQAKVRAKTKDKLRNFLLNMAQEFQAKSKHLHISQSSNQVLKNHFETLKNETIEKQETFKTQLNDFKKVSEKKYRDLDEKYQKTELSNDQLRQMILERDLEINELQETCHEEKKNRIKLKHLSEELSQEKNDRISNKRSLETTLEKSENARQMEVEKTLKLQSELDQLSLEFAENKEVLQSCETKMLAMNRDNKEIAGQLDTLQKLWLQAQERLEAEELKTKSLEKINRELSQNYKNDRLDRAINQANPENSKVSNNNDSFNDKISEVYASQYLPINKGPRMDV